MGGIQVDNITRYLNLIKAIAEYSSPGSKLKTLEGLDGMVFHIVPGHEDFRQDIIKNILAINRIWKIKVIFSKSLKIQKNISFVLDNPE